MTLKDELPQVGRCEMMLLEKSGEITPERMKSGDKAKATPSCGCD